MPVYFVQSVDGGPVKIGYTRHHDPNRRLRQLQIFSPSELRIIGLIRLAPRDEGLGLREGRERALERRLHKTFARNRLRGEWFSPTEELIALIRGHAAQ